MIKEKTKKDSGPDILTVNHVASSHNHKGPHASGALKGTFTPTTYHITPPPPVTSCDSNKHHLQRSVRHLRATCCSNKTQRSPSSSRVVAFCTPFTLFLHLSSSSGSDQPWPSAQKQALAGFVGQTGAGRQTTQYRLGADRDRVGDAWTGVKNKEGEG